MAYGIEAERLVRDFKEVRAVDGIDLAVAEGEIYGFLGPNGAGKSTTVHMLTTLLPPTDGSARVAGFDVVKEGPKVRRAIGAALQEAALDPLLTGREHLRLQTSLHGIAKAERNLRSDELLERVGLEAAAERKVRTYSGGMKRRLDLALALVHRPRILFLDEPTTGLDPQSRTALWAEVGRLAQEDGVTVFLTTQYLEEADVLANRVGIIDHGRIVAEGTPAELKAEIAHPTVEAIPADPEQRPQLARILEQFGEISQVSPKSLAVRLTGDEFGLADIVRALDAADLHVEHLQLHAPSLDDVFLAQDRPHARGRRLRAARDHRHVTASSGFQPGSAQPHAHAAPARVRHPAASLPDDARGRQRRRPQAVDAAQWLSHRLVPSVRRRRAVHSGRALRDDERGDGPCARHPERLPQSARADADARQRAPRRPPRRRDGHGLRPVRLLPRCARSPSASRSSRASPASS